MYKVQNIILAKATEIRQFDLMQLISYKTEHIQLNRHTKQKLPVAIKLEHLKLLQVREALYFGGKTLNSYKNLA